MVLRISCTWYLPFCYTPTTIDCAIIAPLILCSLQISNGPIILLLKLYCFYTCKNHETTIIEKYVTFYETCNMQKCYTINYNKLLTVFESKNLVEKEVLFIFNLFFSAYYFLAWPHQRQKGIGPEPKIGLDWTTTKSIIGLLKVTSQILKY